MTPFRIFAFHTFWRGALGVCVALVLGLSSRAQSQLLLEENFTFTGALTANGWTASSAPGTNALNSAPPGLTYTALPSSGAGNAVTLTNSGEDDYKLLAATNSSGDIYTSFLVNVSLARTGDYFYAFYSTATSGGGYFGRVHVRSNSTGFNFGIGKTTAVTGTSPTYETNVRSLNTTYLVVAKMSRNAVSTNDDVVSLWINPALGTSEVAPDITNAVGLDSTNFINAVALRQGGTTLAPNLRSGNILVGTTWASVTPTTAAGGPSITSFNPTAGPAGTVVTIGGSNFTGATNVTFNSVAATSFTVNSASQITATVPSGATTGPIGVATPLGFGASADNFVIPSATVTLPVQINEGATGTGTVTLTSAAPVGGVVVSLVSSSPPDLVVPVSVTVAEGFASADFQIEAPLDGTVDADVVVTVTPSATNYVGVAGSITVKNIDISTAPLTSSGYTESFAAFTSAATLPLGWSIQGSLITYGGDWGTGTSAGTRGNASVFGYQHTGSSGTVTQTLTMSNATGAEINNLTVSYSGRVAVPANGRTPSYTVTIGGTAVTALAYSTADGDNVVRSASISGLAIAANQVFQIVWSSDRGAGTGSSQQIGISSVSVSATAALLPPTVGSLSVPVGSIAQTSAGANANVSADGGSALTARGFVYAPTSVNADPTIGGTGVINVVDPLADLGAMSATLTGLTASTQYSVKAYATNAQGTSYTAVQTFATLAPPASFTGNYSYAFDNFTGVAGLPGEWTAISSSNVQSYIGLWSSGSSSAGFYGGVSAPGVIGYTHTSATGTLTITLRMVNNTGSTLSQLYAQYLGRVTATNGTRFPEWAVTVAGNTVSGLTYSTSSGVDETKSATITGLNISNGQAFDLTWVSTRGENATGNSRRIGLGDFLLSATAPSSPSISVDPGSLNVPTAVVGTNGAGTNFTASGSNLLGDITVTANDATNFAVSTNAASGFTNSLVLGNSAGSVAPAPVYVRMTGTNIGTFTNTVSLASSNATTQNVTVIGTVEAPAAPALTAIPATITNLATTAGTPSDALAFTASGTVLSNDITVSAIDATNFAVSTNSTNGFAPSLVLTNSGGSVAATPVYVRLTGVSAGAFTNTVSLQSGALSTNVTVGGTVSSTNDPFVDVDPLALGGFAASLGNFSTNQTVSVTGANLTNPVQVTATGPFEVSTNGTNFSSSVSVPVSGGTFIFTNSTNWVAPTGVSFVQVECWGAGGAGGSALRATGSGSTNFAGGGAGGAYAKVTNLPVSSGSTYTVTVGMGASNSSITPSNRVDGGDSWFGASASVVTNVIAKGGLGAINLIGDLSAGTTPPRLGPGGAGTTNGSFGNVVFAGGNGGTGSSTNVSLTGGGGGGGSAAGVSANGVSASNAIGAVAPLGGGNGGDGAKSSADGTNGVTPGGGGGGAASSSATIARSGGKGGNGQVVITAPPFFPQTTVFVRMSSSAVAGTNTGTLNITSAGAAPRTVNLSGFVTSTPAPAVTATPPALSGFVTTAGTASTNQQITVGGSNLTANITLKPPAGWQISATNSNNPTSANIVLATNASGIVSNTTVFVRLSASNSVATNYTGSILAVESGTAATNVLLSGVVNPAPAINVSTNLLPAFSAIVGTNSTATNFTAGGSNLTTNITIAAPTGFSLSFVESPFAATNSLVLSNVGGVAADKLVWVRMDSSATPVTRGPTNIVLSSSGASNRTVSVSGNITAAQPSLTATPPSLTNFFTSAGTASAAQFYTLSGSNLGAVTVTAPTGFQVALTNTNSAFSSSVAPVPSSGVLNTNIFVRVSAGAATNTNLVGVISNVSGTASTNVSLQARVVPAPTLSAVPTALSNFSTIVGIASTNQPFSLSASNLLGLVNLSVTNGYEISLSTNSGFATNLVLVPTALGAPVSVAASDNADNYASGWTNGANGGAGFGPWVITANGGTGFAGVFIGTPTTAGIATNATFGTNAFGMYANPGGSGASANADRTMPALKVGQTFSFQWAINWDSDVGNKGFKLYSGGTSGTDILTVNQAGFPGDISFAAGGVTNTNIGLAFSNQAMTWSFTMTSSNNLFVTSTGRDGSNNIAFRTNVTVAAAPDSFRWYVSAMGSGDQRQPYFNNLQIASASGNISNLPVYVRLATNAPIAEATNSLLSRVTISSTAVPLPGVLAAAASSPTYNAYNDFYFNKPSPSPNGAPWTGPTSTNSWSYWAGNINGFGGFPKAVGTYLSAASGNLYGLSQGGIYSGPGATYSLVGSNATTGQPNTFFAYNDNQGWGVSLGKYNTGWVPQAPGGSGFDNAASTNQYLWMQAAYLGNNTNAPNGPAEGIASVLNWTAPSNGIYNFSGAFLPANNGTTGTNGTPYAGQSLVTLAIVNSKGGTNLAPRTAPQNNVPVGYNFTQSLSAGDIVQFQVGTAFQTGAAVGLSVNVAPATESSNVFAYVDLSGRVEDRPTITVVPNALANLVATNGYAGASTNFTVSGRNLTNDIVLSAAPTNSYQISTNSASGFTNTITLVRSNGQVSSNSIFVRIASTAPVSTNANSLTGNVTLVSLSAITNVSLSGRVLEDSTIPVVETSTNALSGLGSVEGAPGVSTNFNVNGRFLRGNIVLTAPSNFAISTNNSSFASFLQLVPDPDRVVPPTPVYVRITESAPPGAVSGSIALNSSNLPSPLSVALSGTVTNWPIANPYGIRVTNPVDFVSTNATNFTFSGQIGTAIDRNALSWFNLLNNQSNNFAGGTNQTWSVSVPLGLGFNTLSFSAQFLTNAGTTNISLDAAGDPAYAAGWQSGDNGGYGYKPWQLYSEGGVSALYRTDTWVSTNMNVSPFNGGITYGFAFESIVWGVANAYRPFVAPLQAPGGSFTVWFDSNDLQLGGTVGLQLVSSNKSPLFTFAAVNNGSGPAYAISDKTNAAIEPGWTYKQDGLFLRFEMTSSNAYSFTATSSTFTNTNTGTISNTAVAGVIFFTEGAGSVPDANFYIGQMMQNGTLYEFATASTVAPDVERTTAPPATAYDLWAQGYGLSPTGNGAPTADPDGDGFANDMEFAFGTSPVAPNGTLLDVAQSGGNMVVTFLARTSNVTYAVMQKANLAASVPAWADSGIVPTAASDQTGVPANYQRRTFSVPASGQNFYRVRATFSQ